MRVGMTMVVILSIIVNAFLIFLGIEDKVQAGSDFASSRMKPLFRVTAPQEQPATLAEQAVEKRLQQTIRQATQLSTEIAVSKMALSSDGQWLAVGGQTSQVIVWRLNRAEAAEVAHFDLDGELTALLFSPNNNWLIMGNRQGNLRLWNSQSRQLNGVELNHGAINALTMSKNGQWLGAATDDGTVYLWAVTTINGSLNLEAFFQESRSDRTKWLEFSPNGEWLVSGSGRVITVWDMTNTDHPPSRITTESDISTLTISTDSKWLFTGLEKGQANLWQVHLHSARQPAIVRSVAQWKQDKGPIWLAHFSPNNQQLVTTDGETGYIWQLSPSIAELTVSHTLTSRFNHDDWISCLTFSADGRWIGSASWDGTARIWNNVTGNEIGRMPHEDKVWRILFHPTTSQLVTISDQSAWLWQPDSVNHAQSNIVNEANNLRATKRADGLVYVWNSMTGQDVIRLDNSENLYPIGLTVDGQSLITEHVTDKTIQIWNVSSGQLQAQLPNENNVIGQIINP